MIKRHWLVFSWAAICFLMIQDATCAFRGLNENDYGQMMNEYLKMKSKLAHHHHQLDKPAKQASKPATSSSLSSSSSSTGSSVLIPKLNYLLASQYQSKPTSENTNGHNSNHDQLDEMMREAKKCLGMLYSDYYEAGSVAASEPCYHVIASSAGSLNPNELANAVKRHRPSSKYWFSRAGK